MPNYNASWLLQKSVKQCCAFTKRKILLPSEENGYPLQGYVNGARLFWNCASADIRWEGVPLISFTSTSTNTANKQATFFYYFQNFYLSVKKAMNCVKKWEENQPDTGQRTHSLRAFSVAVDWH